MRLLIPLLTALLGIAFLAAPAEADALTGTLKKIKDNNRLVLGVRDTAPPFSYLDQNQKVVGFAIDICVKIADAVKRELKMPGLEVAMEFVNSSSRIPLITNGTVDLECGTTTNNAERKKQVAFTNTHFLTATRFVSKKDQHIGSLDDLRGKAVASVAGSTNILMLIKANNERKLGITVIAAKDVPEAFLLVETGRAAAFVMDDVQLSVVAAQSKDPSAYVVSQETLSNPEPYGIMLRRDDPAFKAVVDRATADLYRSPEIMTIYDRWFLKPVPPRGLNYNVPLSSALRWAFENPTDDADPAFYAH
jgi:glutamate/aspartate transport system substrate-binding protein